MTDTFDRTRRDFLTVATVGGAAATLGMIGVNPAMAGVAAGRSEKPLKAAFSNAGLQATWCAQGKQAAEYWGKLFNVEVTWFDGELDAVKQRAAIDNMASQKWDFVAIQAFGIGTLTEPVKKMIDAGIPVIDMDTLIAPLDQINVHSFLAPDNEFMGASVTQALVAKLGGKGKIIMTQGALGHTGAQGRAKGFNSVVKQYPDIEVLDTQPADWDVTKVARIWDTYLTKYPQIDAAFFHNDDMALAAYNVMKARNRTNILIGGVDAMPPAIEAVIDGRMLATVRNPSCRIHGGAVIAGVAAVVAGEKTGRRHPQARHHRRAGGHQGQRRRHAVDAEALPDLSRSGRARSTADGERAPSRSWSCPASPRRSAASTALTRRRLRAARRRGPRAGRRERRRQVDADEDHRRRAPGYDGEMRDRRPAGALPLAARRAGRRHRHGAPGAGDRARPDASPRTSFSATSRPTRRRRRLARDGARGARQHLAASASTSTRGARMGSLPIGLQQLVELGPRAVLGRPHHHPRRADLGAVAARGRSGCSPCCAACKRQRPQHRLHLALPRRRAGDLRHGHGVPQRPAHRHRGGRRRSTRAG